MGLNKCTHGVMLCAFYIFGIIMTYFSTKIAMAACCIEQICLTHEEAQCAFIT